MRERVAELEAAVAAKDAEIEGLKAAAAADADRVKEEEAKKDEEVSQLKEAKETDQKAIDDLQFKVDNFDAEKKAAEKKSQQLVTNPALSILLDSHHSSIFDFFRSRISKSSWQRSAKGVSGEDTARLR